MTSDEANTSGELMRRVRSFVSRRRRPSWIGALLITIGWLVAQITLSLPGRFDDPSSLDAVGLTAAAAAASLGAIGGGTTLTITAALSPARFVFRSTPAFRIGTMLLVIGLSGLFALVLRTPFDGIFAYGKPLAELIADITSILASIICLAGASIAFRSASNARRSERV